MKKTYMKQLDGLRAFAVLFTLVTHFTSSRQGLLGFVPWAWMGVRLFFVLSGFLITSILLRTRPEHGRASSLRIFYCRRFLRIFPVYYATLFVAFVINIRPVRQTFFWHLLYLSNVCSALRPILHTPVMHFWSLAVEEQFYFLWPCLMFFVPRRYLLRTMIAAVCMGPMARLLSVFLHFDFAGMGPIAFFDTLGMGAILAYLWDPELGNPAAIPIFSRASLWIGLPSSILLYAFEYKHVQWLGLEHSLFPVLFDLALAFLFVWLINGAAQGFTGLVGATLEWRPLNYLGRISYGVYVVHAFMPVVLFYGLKWAHRSLPDSSLARFVVLAAMSVAVASASWHFFENPINRLKRYFEYDRPDATVFAEPDETESPLISRAS